MVKFELRHTESVDGRWEPELPDRMDSAILLRNIRWFTRVRWVIIGLFLLLGIVGVLLGEFLNAWGFVAPRVWPWVIGGILAVANTFFALRVAKFDDESPDAAIRRNLARQTVADLLVIAATAHMVGTLTTIVFFVYLLHIVLSCVALSSKTSLKVVVLASLLLVGCVALERGGLLPPGRVWLDGDCTTDLPVRKVVFQLASVLAGWFGVWYLVSTLAASVRRRDRELFAANQKLVAVDQEMNRRVLATTHDLKAPFTGISTNIQLLQYRYWETLSDPVKNIIEHIDARGRTLSERIRDILTLGKLRSEAAGDGHLGQANIRQVIEGAVTDVGDAATEREVTIDCQVPDATVQGNAGRLKILFANLLANAVFYSHEKGTVHITAHEEEGRLWISIRDEGIGIQEDALPHIFDEYYRTREASKFNRLSTGLGLAIVKEIATALDLRVRVGSEHGKGTTFEIGLLRLPDQDASA